MFHLVNPFTVNWDLNAKFSHWKRRENLKLLLISLDLQFLWNVSKRLVHLKQRDVQNPEVVAFHSHQFHTQQESSPLPSPQLSLYKTNKSSLTCAPWGCDDVHMGSSSSVPMPWNWYSAWFPNSAAANKKPVFNTFFCGRGVFQQIKIHKNGSFVKVSFPKRNYEIRRWATK